MFFQNSLFEFSYIKCFPNSQKFSKNQPIFLVESDETEPKIIFNCDFYERFLWQICGFIPQTLENPQEMTEMAAQLTTTFFLETFIHSKEKVNFVLRCE